MINFDGKELQEEFNRVFKDFTKVIKTEAGNSWDIGPELTFDSLSLEQLWWLVKFAKHVRGRCRNNSAFNNYMNRNFSPATFREVPKTYEKRIDNISTETVNYRGLQIKVGDKVSEGDNDE